MSTPFFTSLRRSPKDPRGLLERIDAQVRERVEEAVEIISLDLLVQLRRRQARPLPAADNRRDREEFHGLVREFLEFLTRAFLGRLPEAEAKALRGAEAATPDEEEARLLAIQTRLARTLPDYWQLFDEIKTTFTEERLAAPLPAKPGSLNRLRRR